VSVISEQTSAGRVEVIFGVNGWVMVGLGRGDRVQSRVSSARELATVLLGLHLMDEEARTVAERVWRDRPSDFALPSPHGDESPRHATGIPGYVIVMGLLALVALVLYVLIDVLGG
jgi:hypothetical protein